MSDNVRTIGNRLRDFKNSLEFTAGYYLSVPVALFSSGYEFSKQKIHSTRILRLIDELNKADTKTRLALVKKNLPYLKKYVSEVCYLNDQQLQLNLRNYQFFGSHQENLTIDVDVDQRMFAESLITRKVLEKNIGWCLPYLESSGFYFFNNNNQLVLAFANDYKWHYVVVN